MTAESLHFRAKNGDIGYVNAPFGYHMIEKNLKNLLKEAGHEGNYTLHSLRRTDATRLFQAGIPEKIIKEMINKSIAIFNNNRMW